MPEILWQILNMRKEDGVKKAQSKSLWVERQAISEKQNREIDDCNSLTNYKYAQRGLGAIL